MMSYTAKEAILLPAMFGFIVVVCIVLGICAKHFKWSNRTRRTIMISIPIFLIGFEITKQIVSIALGVWDYYKIPLHICGTFMLWFGMAEFARDNTKTRKVGQAIAFGLCITYIPFYFLVPQAILFGDANHMFSDFFSFHRVIFHQLPFLYLGLTLAFNTYSPSYSNAKYCANASMLYFFTVLTFSYTLNTNFACTLHGMIQSMEDFRLHYGQGTYLIVYLFVITACITVAHTLGTLIYNYSHRYAPANAPISNEPPLSVNLLDPSTPLIVE